MEPMHPACLPEVELLRSCSVRKTRTSGPGGQHRNKVESGIELVHTPSGIVGQAGERRSSEENRRVAVKRLRLALAVGVRWPVPSGDARSELWRRRTVIAVATGTEKRVPRIVCNDRHEDFPALLAEALDMLEACRGDVSRAALRLDVTPTSVLKLLKGHPPALVQLNAWRAERGLHPLK